tara:strand:+ start:658 stop:1074 length:417 start_codon:yes stop_codon:yes gene_type:complete
VIEPFVRQLLFQQKYLFLCGFMATPDMSAIQRYRNRGSDSAIYRVVRLLTSPNRTIVKDIARIIGDAIGDGIAFLIKRANQIESVIDGLAVIGLVGMRPANGCAHKRVDCEACSLTAEVSVLIDKIFARHNLDCLVGH